MRELLTHPNSDNFTQGSIFEGLQVGNEYAHGIVITARCDIANRKARNILCLPVYKAKEWINKQGGKIIYRRIEEKLENKINAELKKFKISPSLLTTYPIQNIKDNIERSKGNKDPSDLYQYLDMYKTKSCDFSLKFVGDERKSFVSTLLKNDEASIYFLEQINLSDALEPYIIDLSEPQSIPHAVATRLLTGLTKKTATDEIFQYLNVYKDEISYISELKSPYIEHVLQKFSSFYSRIGTENMEKEAINLLKEKLNEI